MPMPLSRSYHVGLVGERSYQPAINACGAGEAVMLAHEPDNPYDEEAIAAFCPRGRKIGYLARSSWVREAIHEEGKGCAATIATLHKTEGGPIGVVLLVDLNGPAVEQRAFAP